MNLQGYCLVVTVTVRTKSPCLGHGQRQTEERGNASKLKSYEIENLNKTL